MNGDASSVVFEVERFNRAGVLNDSGEHSDSDRSRIRVYSISRPRQKALDWSASEGQRSRRGLTMKACLLRASAAMETNPLEYGEVAAPQPKSGEVLVRVRACGVC